MEFSVGTKLKLIVNGKCYGARGSEFVIVRGLKSRYPSDQCERKDCSCQRGGYSTSGYMLRHLHSSQLHHVRADILEDSKVFKKIGMERRCNCIKCFGEHTDLCKQMTTK